jgi:hypothetical protein
LRAQGNRNGAAAGPPRCSSTPLGFKRCSDRPQVEMRSLGADDSDASDLDVATARLRLAE